MTAQDIIVSALRKLRVTASGEMPKPEELADALVVLNDMLDAWNNQKLLVFTDARQVFALQAGKQAYTLGPGGDFNVVRPPRIENAGIINLANPAQPLELGIDLISDKKWAGVPVKNIASQLPYEVWDDGGFPLRTLTFYPAPSVALQTALYTWTMLTQFPDLVVTDVTYPAGYARAIKNNLAVELYPEFEGADLSPAVAAIAAESKAGLKTFNAAPVEIRCDDAVVGMNESGRYNWLTDNN